MSRGACFGGDTARTRFLYLEVLQKGGRDAWIFTYPGFLIFLLRLGLFFPLVLGLLVRFAKIHELPVCARLLSRLVPVGFLLFRLVLGLLSLFASLSVHCGDGKEVIVLLSAIRRSRYYLPVCKQGDLWPMMLEDTDTANSLDTNRTTRMCQAS